MLPVIDQKSCRNGPNHGNGDPGSYEAIGPKIKDVISVVCEICNLSSDLNVSM